MGNPVFWRSPELEIAVVLPINNEIKLVRPHGDAIFQVAIQGQYGSNFVKKLLRQTPYQFSRQLYFDLFGLTFLRNSWWSNEFPGADRAL
jgi:hypothetical protein